MVGNLLDLRTLSGSSAAPGRVGRRLPLDAQPALPGVSLTSALKRQWRPLETIVRTVCELGAATYKAWVAPAARAARAQHLLHATSAGSAAVATSCVAEHEAGSEESALLAPPIFPCFTNAGSLRQQPLR